MRDEVILIAINLSLIVILASFAIYQDSLYTETSPLPHRVCHNETHIAPNINLTLNSGDILVLGCREDFQNCENKLTRSNGENVSFEYKTKEVCEIK